jgi:hypothetical protein
MIEESLSLSPIMIISSNSLMPYCLHDLSILGLLILFALFFLINQIFYRSCWLKFLVTLYIDNHLLLAWNRGTISLTLEFLSWFLFFLSWSLKNLHFSSRTWINRILGVLPCLSMQGVLITNYVLRIIQAYIICG